MRVVRVGTPPVVVRVRTRNEVYVAVPECLPPETVLALARLVLSSTELAQLQHRLQPGQASEMSTAVCHGAGPTHRR
jgi:hypothetical protein